MRVCALAEGGKATSVVEVSTVNSMLLCLLGANGPAGTALSNMGEKTIMVTAVKHHGLRSVGPRRGDPEIGPWRPPLENTRRGVDECGADSRRRRNSRYLEISRARPGSRNKAKFRWAAAASSEAASAAPIGGQAQGRDRRSAGRPILAERPARVAFTTWASPPPLRGAALSSPARHSAGNFAQYRACIAGLPRRPAGIEDGFSTRPPRPDRAANRPVGCRAQL